MYLKALLDHPTHGPLIRSTEIQAPIIIVGAPRTASTFLHFVLATHPELRYLSLSEAWNPMAELEEIMAHEEDIVNTDKDKRVGTMQTSMYLLTLLRPLLSNMLPIDPEAPFEDMLISAHCFGTTYWEFGVGGTPK